MTAEQKRIKTEYNLKHAPSMTACRKTAFEFRGRGEAVILGDNEAFWILCFADASKCVAHGLQKAA